MHISALQIHGFGQLSDLLLDGLTPGLNVIYGPNGSGKSTLLQFLRSMLLGFDEARQLGLLPPKDWAPTVRRQAGGSISLVDGDRKFGLVRTAGMDQQEHLAIRVQDGNDLHATEFRSRLGSLKPDFVKLFSAVGTSESHSIEAMLRQAMRDELPLASTVTESPVHHARVEEIRSQRAKLLSESAEGEHPEGTLARLDQQRRQMAASLESARQMVIARFRTLIDREQELTQLVASLSVRVEQQHLDLQARQHDLRCAEDELWDGRARMQQRTTATVENHVVSAPVASHEDAAECDQQIDRARLLLHDLAETRHRLSRGITELLSHVPSTSADSHRSTRLLAAELESQVSQWVRATHERRESTSACRCDELTNLWTDRLVSLSQSLQRLSSEASIHDLTVQLKQLSLERDQVDDCEREVTTYLRRLLTRRQDLQDASSRSQTSAAAVLRFSHEQYEQQLAELEEQHDRLREVHNESWAAYQSTLAEWSRAFERLRRVRIEHTSLSTDDGLDRLRFQLKVLDQEAQRLHEDLQALNLAESALTRSRTMQRIETPSRLIQQASQRFCTLTQERYREFRFVSDASALLAVNQRGESLNLALLSRGTLDQAALSLRLAIIQEYAAHGERWPVVLDEVLADSDLDRLQSAAALLQQFAGDSHQVVYLTCLEHLVEVLRSAGANVLVMPGHQVMLREPAERAAVGPHWLSAREDVKQRYVATVSQHGNGSRTGQPQREHATSVAAESRPLRQPGDGYWLQLDSPVSLVPSLGPQMAGRLGSIGLRRVVDLIVADARYIELPWEHLQITQSQFLIWQAEATMLYGVPRLTGRDAQLLVAAGIVSVEQLARENAESLMRRLDRLRGTSLDHGVMTVWPRHADLAMWIESATHSRALPSEVIASRQQTAVHEDHASCEPDEPASGELRFFLDLTSPVVDAPSIGPTTARKLARIGVNTVSDFLNRDADIIASRLGERRISAETILTWQRQSRLMIRVPELRGHDAQVLVACGICDPESLTSMQPSALFATVGPFVATKEGQRLLRSAKTPDLDEVTDWIAWAQHARTLRAA